MTISDWFNTIWESLKDILTRVIDFLPNLIGAIIILIVGWLVGWLIEKLIDRLFRAVGLQALFGAIRLEEVLKKGKIEKDTTGLIAAAAKWIIYLIAFISAADILNLNQVSLFLNQILAYVPDVIAAAAIVVIGLVLANFLSQVTKGSMRAANLKKADTVALVVRYSVIVFSILAALMQLRIAVTFLQTLFIGVVALIAISVGLALGLGGKDVAKEYLEKLRDQLKE